MLEMAATGHFETKMVHGSRLDCWSLAPSWADALALARAVGATVGRKLAALDGHWGRGAVARGYGG